MRLFSRGWQENRGGDGEGMPILSLETTSMQGKVLHSLSRSVLPWFCDTIPLFFPTSILPIFMSLDICIAPLVHGIFVLS